MNTDSPELERDEYTEFIFEKTCYGEPVNAEKAEDVIDGIARAVELDNRPFFLEGLTARLTRLGTPCTCGDTEIIIAEVKRRYKTLLGKNCPRTVLEWCRGTTPGVTNRQNNYELCFALEMDFRQTMIFFEKHFLTLPFIVKAKTDAVFMYCLYHKKTYSAAVRLLESSAGFEPRKIAHTSTSQIASAIFGIDDDEKFLSYLSEHCYDNERQFQLARRIINSEIEVLKAKILADVTADILSPDRLGSLTVDALMGYRYQSRCKGKNKIAVKLPKRFTESLPNDVTLGQVIKGDKVTYEVLRKYLMLLKFCNYYRDAESEDMKRGHEPDKYEINDRLMDFYDELNGALLSCGFAQLYVRHPFDCLLLYCANSYDPILTFHLLFERN